MPSKPRPSAACAQSRIFAGSVPMSRVGKRAFSNIEVSSQGVQFWTGVDRQSQKVHRSVGAWMPECRAMQDIIRQKNLEHFRSLLKRTSDREERLLILMLLAEEQLK